MRYEEHVEDILLYPNHSYLQNVTIHYHFTWILTAPTLVSMSKVGDVDIIRDLTNTT